MNIIGKNLINPSVKATNTNNVNTKCEWKFINIFHDLLKTLYLLSRILTQ
jgi:hypothetical protein